MPRARHPSVDPNMHARANRTSFGARKGFEPLQIKNNSARRALRKLDQQRRCAMLCGNIHPQTYISLKAAAPSKEGASKPHHRKSRPRNDIELFANFSKPMLLEAVGDSPHSTC